ncbi:hypothetical protein FBR05_05160 [Deltaproteobacteria bacterium PRO3]|nr:hypothetical protein [Deltaproteobacteria bacterium PRO3]
MSPPVFPSLRALASPRAAETGAIAAESETNALLAFSLGADSLRGGAEEGRRLEVLWGRAALAELEALKAESDPQLVFEGLGALATRLAAEDRLEAAQAAYAFIAGRAADSAPAAARRAQEEWDAIRGRGALGPRLEFLGRRFAREASSPAMLAGMGVASTVFQLSRAAFLARLTATPSLGLLSRGFGARAVAGLGAFALEAPAFALTARGARLALGDPAATAAPLGHEILGSYLTLGGLKLFGGLGAAAVRYAGAGPVSRTLIPQISTYFGIVAGHRLEQLAGLRPALSGDTLWADSLVTLLQFHVGGRLAGELGGPRLAAWQRELELRGAVLAREPEGSGSEPRRPGWAPTWLLGEAAMAAPAGGPSGRELPNIFMMQGPEGGGGRPRGERLAAGGNGSRRGSVPLGERNAYQIVQELLRCRERSRRGGQDLSLWQLMRRKLEAGSIPAERAEELQWAVFAYSLFENSPILRREFARGVSDNFETVAYRLNALRAEVAREQGQDNYSLGTLVQALAYGGRIPFEKTRQYLSAASALDFYLQTPSLRSIGKEHFSDPYRLIRRLRELMPAIEERREHSYKLSTLVDALRWHPHFPRSQLQAYTMAAAASDFVRALPLERLRLAPAQLRGLDIEQIYLRLLHLKPVLRGESGDPVTIGYVLSGLRSEGLVKIKGGTVNDSALTNAHVLDFAFNRWSEWGGHYRNLAEIPRNGEGSGARAGWTRPRYAQRFLLKENGQPYSYSYAGNLVRWGEFLWNHREALQLPEPGHVEVPPLASSRRTRLLAFLEPHWEALREKAPVPEEFFEGLAGLRQQFQRSAEERSAVAEGEPGEVPSLRIMVGAFFKAKGAEIPRSLEVYAATIDTILQRWPEWRRHLRRLSEVTARGHAGARERYRIAEEGFQQANGEPYSRTILGGLIRWGSWVWEHRGRLGLRSGESTVPPPGDESGRESGE